jgi:hypothetical protein
MKKIVILFAIFSCTPLITRAQDWEEKVSTQMNIVYLWPFTDVSGNQHDFNRFNIGLNIGISYDLNERTSIRGSWLIGTMDGESGIYSETFLTEPSLLLDYNIMPWLNEDSKLKWNISGGVGLIFFYSRLYSAPGSNSRLLDRHPRDSPYSSALTGTAGSQLQYPITDQISLQLSSSMKFLYANDYLDAYENNASDAFATIELGAVIRLGKSVKESEVLVDKASFNALSIAEKNAREELSATRSQYEVDMRKKNMRITALQNSVDSLRAEKTKRILEAPVDTQIVETSVPNNDAPMWRVVIGSFPTQARAQQFVDRVNLDNSEMQILYVEEYNTFRVIYKSFSSSAAALKARGDARKVIEDAWVIKF